MKTIFLMAFAIIAFQVSAQQGPRNFQNGNRGDRMGMLQDLTPEQASELRTKRMTLNLDLTEAQQKELQAINLEEAKYRKAKMTARQSMRQQGQCPSSDVMAARMNERLDRQIEYKKKVKRILTDEQYEKWETIRGQNQKQMLAQRGKSPRNR
ncbi:Spy/CpxP family protein refolding chaperone [Mangrovimonas sp. YM274]|uniref:Spy/CpxP family protein refolding chaperone n=1 Tax=Mangrovimonas sp. YM274 TaxID=3070660 RepID=UPI0027DB169E|nr:hypothetical protein [Mangrovimonas sp. YM274]WMI69627.1 hypothetical protein RBH95_04470 [Mangrovimonas sp. YM274]